MTQPSTRPISATSPATSSTGASPDSGPNRAAEGRGSSGPEITFKILLSLGAAYFYKQALGHHRAGRHHYAAICWLCVVSLWVLVPLAMIIGTSLLPPGNDYGAPIREAIFNTTHIRLPSAMAFSVPTLKPTFTLASPGGSPIPGSQGRRCLTGEIISVSFKVEERTAILMFGYDGKAVYPLERSPLQRVSYGVGEVSDRVQLSKNAPGETLAESIFVVWSRRPFDAEADVFSTLYKLNAGSVARGGVATHPQLQLPAGLLQDSFTCVHTNAPGAVSRSP